MERICPDAWLVHVTNPLSQLTRAVCMETSIKCVGLCHNYSGTISMLADYFGVKTEDVNAVSVGVNHFTWMKNITIKGRPADSELSVQRYVEYFQNKNGVLRTNTTDDVISQMLVGKNMEYYLNFVLFERFGYFPVGSSNHVAENLPFYCNDLDVMKKYHIRRKGVLPRRQMLNEKKQQEIFDIMNGKKPIPEIQPSSESLADIVESLYTGKASRNIVAMPNQGQITNLPKDVIVETWADVNGSGIFPVMSGEIPEYLTGYMQTVIDEQEATVKAAITGDRNLIARAMHISPQVFNKEIVEDLTDELLEAHRKYLPHFQ
jgi:alpha-galactosidase/6-phospho-beta-glucosidase family protein